MLSAQRLRELRLDRAPGDSRPPFFSAASGLVAVGDCLYVVADDDLHLGVFATEPTHTGQLVRLLDGTLPEDFRDRKSQKPDLETLMKLPAFAGFPDGALLAMGSGSTLNRDAGVMLSLDAAGRIGPTPSRIDLSGLFNPLRAALGALNIEGAAACGHHLVMLQRGNNEATSAMIVGELDPLLGDLAAKRAPSWRATPTIRAIDLGDIDGVPLSFTDAAALPDGNLLFSAVAENTGNSYDDGVCKGSAIGIVDLEGRLTSIERLDPLFKVEGIAASIQGSDIHILMVTDADDPGRPAWLLSAVLERP